MESYSVPQNISLERDVLSASLYNPLLSDILCYELKVTDFTFVPHMQIFSAFQNFNNENIEISIDLFFRHFQTQQGKDALNALLDMHNQYFSSDMLKIAIKQLKDVSIQRDLFNASNAGLKMFNGVCGTSPQTITAWIDNIRAIHCGYASHKYSSLKDVIAKPCEDDDDNLLAKIQKRQELHRSGKEVFTGHKTRYADIDKLFDGFNDGHLTLIGARPGVGKTTFMINLALKQLLLNKNAVGIFSLEMPTLQIAERFVYCHADVDWKSVKHGTLTSEEYRRVVVSSGELSETTLLLDDKGRADLNLIQSRAHHWKDRYGVKLIFIDYIQLIKAGGKFNNKYEEVTHISQQLKIMSKELNIPVIALAQLNRSSEETKDKIPQSSDLRDSGSLEQDADEIFLLHSPSLYTPTDKPGILQVFLRKNRFGPTGKVDLAIKAESGQINNLSRIEDENPFFSKNWQARTDS